MPTPTKRPARKSTPAQKPLKEANGAVQEPSKESTPKSASQHETHGGYTPITGPILNVQQLIRNRNIGVGTIGSFESIGAYSKYLHSLSTADLHRHAVEEAHIVAIDDRDRLIRRLEAEWTGVSAREAMGGINKHVPKRAPFTAEQMAAQAELRNKLLKGKITTPSRE